ncbi:SDR family oxidoreductase [Candidatus Bipolaricaulota bacterium]|nr:SDR family oxidoreductase [Candidatus Bipolaricaulota bacterium]
MDLHLEDKFAVITGGSKGIGFAVAKELARENTDIALIARTEADLKKAADKIEQEYDVRALHIPADVTKKEDIFQVVSTLESKTDGIDILVNNAGTGSEEVIAQAKDEKWQYYWDLHVMAPIRLTRKLIPQLKQKGEGVVLNTASICAKQPLDYEPIYNTTKAALLMVSKNLSQELIGENIRVNAISPGLVLTSDWKKTAAKLTENKEITKEEYLTQIAEDKTPIGRFATPDEVASLYAFLSSPLASYCVGSNYYIDGGWLNSVV